MATLNNLRIETVGTEEEAAKGLVAALGMEVKDDRDSEVEEGGEGTQKALGALEFLTQNTYPSRTTPIDAHNGFNELACLTVLWTVGYRWPAGARFPLNCYRYCVQLLLC